MMNKYKFNILIEASVKDELVVMAMFNCRSISQEYTAMLKLYWEQREEFPILEEVEKEEACPSIKNVQLTSVTGNELGRFYLNRLKLYHNCIHNPRRLITYLIHETTTEFKKNLPPDQLALYEERVEERRSRREN